MALATVMPAQPARAQVSAAPWPVVIPVTPGQQRPVAANSPLAYVAARITARAPIARVALLIDGVPVHAHALGRDDTHQSIIYQPRQLLPGVHVAYLIVWDSAGYYGWRAWNFSIMAPRR